MLSPYVYNDMEDNTDVQDDNSIFEMKLKEDVAAELEDFILLSRLGVHDEAMDVAEHILWRHLQIFPVMAEISGYLIEQQDLHRLRRLVQDLDHWHITFAATEECDFVELLRTLLAAPALRLIRISDLLPKYSDLLSERDLIDYDSPVKLQITEVVATVASLDLNLSDVSYFKFAANHFELLLAEGRLWEAVRMLSISWHRAILENADFPTVCGNIREFYGALTDQLGDSGSFEGTTGSAGRQSEILCSLSATASLMQLMLVTKRNSADFRQLHLRLGALLQECFDTLSNSKPRGGYADLWTNCDRYFQHESMTASTSLECKSLRTSEPENGETTSRNAMPTPNKDAPDQESVIQGHPPFIVDPKPSSSKTTPRPLKQMLEPANTEQVSNLESRLITWTPQEKRQKRRPMTRQQVQDREMIRKMGGPCNTCRRRKQKCSPSHHSPSFVVGNPRMLSDLGAHCDDEPSLDLPERTYFSRGTRTQQSDQEVETDLEVGAVTDGTVRSISQSEGTYNPLSLPSIDWFETIQDHSPFAAIERDFPSPWSSHIGSVLDFAAWTPELPEDDRYGIMGSQVEQDTLLGGATRRSVVTRRKTQDTTHAPVYSKPGSFGLDSRIPDSLNKSE